MGNAGKGQEELSSSALQQEPKELTPLQRWESSEKNQEDLIALFANATHSQASNALYQLLRSIAKREKYQNYLMAIIDYLQSEPARQSFPDNQRKALFTTLSRRLKHSFFVTQEFPDSHLNFDQTPSDKLYFLYEFYTQAEELLQKAIFFNYPTIFTSLPQFIQTLLENEVLVNQSHLWRLIVPFRRVEDMRNYCQLSLRLCMEEQREKLLLAMQKVYDMKAIYLESVEAFLKYDYADAASNFMRNLQVKGYELTEAEIEQWLKIQIYNLLLYELSKLSLSFDTLRNQTITEILHYFYSNHELQQTPMLIKCFDVYPNKPQKVWNRCIGNYLFSPLAHISTLLRLQQHGNIELEGNQEEFQLLLGKIRGSRCEIGKYSDQLTNIALIFEVQAVTKTRYRSLVKLMEIYHAFGINKEVEFLYEVVFADWQKIPQGKSSEMSQRGLTLLRDIVQGYFKSFQVKQKTLSFQGQQFSFSSIFQMLRFVHFLKRNYLHDFITHSATHQVFFHQLITHERYVEIKALLSQEKVREFGINPETVGMIVTDHLITVLSERKIRKMEETLRLLFSIIGLSPSGNSWHYVLSYYHYLKYLQQREILLPLPMKQTITTDNLYHIVTHHTHKIEQLDFNFLFGHQSCIKLQYTQTNTPFLPIVTDQFLKFKVFLCSKAFANKRYKMGADIIEEVVKYEPPWIGTELVKILRENPSIDESFIAIAFNYCARGEDLQFILSLAASKGKQVTGSNGKLSLLKLKTWASLLQEDRYLMLTDEIVISQQYKNLVAELTFNEGGQIKSQHFLFFHLLTVEPERAFNYALNYNMPAVFIVNFIQEGLKRGVVHLTNAVPFLIRFLYFNCKKEAGGQQYINLKHPYISLKQYLATPLETLLNEKVDGQGTYSSAALARMVRNYQAQRVSSKEFLDLYLPYKDLYKFLYDQPFRKDMLVGLREQPMSKPNSKVLKSLCERAGVDILELSLYNLMSRANSRDQLDDEAWTIAQKLIHWGDDPLVAVAAVKRLGQKIESLSLLVPLLEFLRESEQTFRIMVTDYHLQVLRSLAAVEVDKNLFGIIPQGFFERNIGVRPQMQRGVLSEAHRRILREAGCVQNIFVLSKALYFMYGCSEEVEKVVLGEFSLQQEDSEEFEELRKKIKREAVE